MRDDYGVHLGKKGKGSRGQTKSVEMSIARKMPKGRPSGDGWVGKLKDGSVNGAGRTFNWLSKNTSAIYVMLFIPLIMCNNAISFR